METSQTVKKVKSLWESSEVQVLMISSLTIQFLLTFLTPLRKRCASGLFGFYMWLLYLCADAVALYTIGVISSSQGDSSQETKLLPFWAPFLVLHLGGPDTITALALEDNELWHRHVLQLVTQRKNVPASQSWLESRGSPERWQPSSRGQEGDIVASEVDEEPSDDHCTVDVPDSLVNNCNASNYISQVAETDDMIRNAYRFYDKFKGILAEGFLSSEDRNTSRYFFLNKPSLEAFRIIEIELNLIYDIFYTKANLLLRKRAFFRVVGLLSVTASLVLFSFENKRDYKTSDVVITFALLVGAIALDVCTGVMFVKSDWWMIIFSDSKSRSLQSIWQYILSTGDKRCSYNRWSRCIPQYNVLNRIYRDRPSLLKLLFVKRIKDALIGWIYVDSVKVHDRHVKFIVDELKTKAEQVLEDSDAVKEVCAARGNLVLQEEYALISEYLNPWTLGIDYDESLLIWHLATDICYTSSTQHINEAPSDTQVNHRQLSKILSDYMSYLLLTKQALVSPVVGKSDMLFKDTSAEAKKFMKTKMLDDSFSAGMKHNKPMRIIKEKIFQARKQDRAPSEFLERFCKRVVENYVRPMVDKGDRSKYVLFNARRLAQQLNMIGEKQWKITSKVWVEMLCYAAVRCSPKSHLAELSKGGELVTLIWLLMAHLGLGDCFLQNQGLRWTKLVIHK